jgi:hypothetical protein
VVVEQFVAVETVNALATDLSGVLVTECHPPVVSVTSTPLTFEKPVLPSETVIELEGPLAAVKPTV